MIYRAERSLVDIFMKAHPVLAVLLLTSFMASFMASLIAPGPAIARPVQIHGEPVPLDAEDQSRVMVGGLRYRGGLVLSSPERSFGGLSALSISPDGASMMALSDRGLWFTARLRYDSMGNLAGILDAALGRLDGTDGRPLSDKTNHDAEAMATGSKGELFVAFERHHRLLRYAIDGSTPQLLAPPMELHLAPSNGGIEALTLLGDERLMILTEDFQNEGGVIGWVGNEDDWGLFTYATDGAYSPTGAATLPGGDVIVVERRYFVISGTVSARLKRVSGAAIKPGAHIISIPIATFEAPLTVDNFEGVAVHQGARGETLITIVSDDNFSRRQRTLLMMFELVE